VQGPVFLLADEQSAGKGRLDRHWASARGNCYSTLMLPVSANIAAIPQIGFVVGLAVADVVRAHTDQTPKLKWPNDVLVHGAKISGILCEVVSTEPLTVAIGCGINVAHAPMGLAYPATCLAAEAAQTDRDTVFQTYQLSLQKWLALWDNGKNFRLICKSWVASAIGIGETATMTIGTQHLTGTYEGITEHGAVILKPPLGPPHILHAGDLHIPSLAALRNGQS
jgi:BirA family transcriptional regulator, biotin operon repressor / biotin---[acetyl-CoA-carboxylase] ligase